MGADLIELGGNITLAGFRERDYAELIVIKKLVGRYARQISDSHQGFERLSVTLKPNGPLNELQARCAIKGQEHAAQAEDRNLFVALDSVLKKLAQQLG